MCRAPSTDVVAGFGKHCWDCTYIMQAVVCNNQPKQKHEPWDGVQQNRPSSPHEHSREKKEMSVQQVQK